MRLYHASCCCFNAGRSKERGARGTASSRLAASASMLSVGPQPLATSCSTSPLSSSLCLSYLRFPCPVRRRPRSLSCSPWGVCKLTLSQDREGGRWNFGFPLVGEQLSNTASSDTVVSIVRLRSIIQFGTSPNVTRKFSSLFTPKPLVS